MIIVLDVHVVNGTPGAATVLGNVFATVAPGGDGAATPGVPIGPNAVLRYWGGLTVAANTVGAIKLQSQDQVDPINGETYVLGAVSLLNLVHLYDYLPYQLGQRQITMGTNTGVTVASAYLVDQYAGGPTVAGGTNIVVTPATTFGGALTPGTWGSQPYTPAVALPNGSYAILGVIVTAMSYGGVIRFQHTDFGGMSPGFPTSNPETVSTSSWDKIWKDDLLNGESGWQFMYLSQATGSPQCPVFRVTNAGTGLTMQILSQVADTPVVSLVLAKVA